TVIENAASYQTRSAEVELRRIAQRHVGGIAFQRDEIAPGADQCARGYLQHPLIGCSIADTEVWMPAEETGGGTVAAVAHPCLEREAGGIEDEAHREIDVERITCPAADRRAQGRPRGTRLCHELRDGKVRIAHEAVARPALSRGCSGLQIVLGAIEAVARIGDPAGEGRHDPE